MKQVIVNMVNGDKKRVNLETCKKLDISDRNYGTGITLENVYLMPRKKIVITKTYSIWENPRTHSCYGTSYDEVDPYTLAKLANESDELMELVDEL